MLSHSSAVNRFLNSAVPVLALSAASLSPAIAAPVPVPDETGIQKTITVDAAAAQVEGTSYKTITEAVDYAVRTYLPTGQKTKVLIKNGIYREAGGIAINGHDNEKVKQTPLIIEGQSAGGVVISGSSLYTGWTPVEGQPGIYQHEWKPNLRMQTYDVPHGPQSILSQRTEMVFVNGQMLTPVMLEKWNYSQPNWTPTYKYEGFAGLNELQENSFGVAELGSNGPGDSEDKLRTAEGEKSLSEIFAGNKHEYSNKIFIKLRPELLPAGKSINDLKIEVADLDANPRSVGAEPFLSVSWKNNLVLRNLKITGFANYGHRSEGVVSFPTDVYQGDQIGLNRVRFQNVEVSNNSNRGVNWASIKNLTVENCRFANNGQNGTSGGRIQDAYYVDSVWDGNNWRSDGFGSQYGWASANYKNVITRNQHFLRCDFLNGHSNGLWFDLVNLDNIIEDVRVINNRSIGFFQEISPGPNTYKNCHAEGNSLGLLIAHSRNTLADGGVYMNNQGGQIVVAGSGPGNERFSAYSGEVFLPENFEKVGIKKTIDADGTALMGGKDAEYMLNSGNNTVRNAYIATGMGGGSALVATDESHAMIGGSDPNGAAEARQKFFKENWHASGNTYFIANSINGKADGFQFGDKRMALTEWQTFSGESGGKISDALYKARPVYLITSQDATGFATIGQWKDDVPPKQEEAKLYYNGAKAKIIEGGKPENATATFTPSITVPGLYRVEARWPAVWLNARNVPFSITHAGGATTVKMDQHEFWNQGWRKLGDFRFVAGTNGSVRIDTTPVDPGNNVHTWTKNVRADAVRWVKLPELSQSKPAPAMSASKATKPKGKS